MSANLKLTLQVGTTANPQDQIELSFSSARTSELVKPAGGQAGTIVLSTAKDALTSITTVNTALTNIRSQREKIGQAQVAMEYNINNRANKSFYIIFIE